MDQLEEKVAIVTGGGSGINLEFVKLLFGAKCNVLIADIALHPRATEWLSSIQQIGPLSTTSSPQVEFIKTDVTDWAQLEWAFTVAHDKFGTVPDIVVPGAGVYEPSANSFWEDNDSDSRYKVLDINLVHPIKMSRLAIRHMIEAGKKGTIIHVSSIAGQRSSLVTPLYQASKHGINSFIRGMASLDSLAGIRVVGVAPGTVQTPLFTENPKASKFLDMKKDFLLPPEVVAKAMLALLTDAKYKSGTVLEVCDVVKWREVSLLNDPGPQGPASLTSRKADAVKDIMRHLTADGNPGSVPNVRIITD
ncbi:uncharacterized protein A1O9_11178 [Exophiala aquamarina CBS 119918]|uniref:3-hydroxybutyrate dehydrogenase n=1 Tax=Exophiala aquamarina CBS 119918 TaxID=1182545 RepID=A0A072NYY6_9EURO|nr:uncharacterized protein A1O9_11178 [Exophiala aquamarina CBS 119918]KEF52761.1 hypothetical protein A1O9_11178 [Exophiala aquamarina CBS 119918]